MYEESVVLNQSKEFDCVNIWVYNENDDLFALSERIIERYEEAYMNGYNWAALIEHWVGQKDPELVEQIEFDPEAGSLSTSIEGCNQTSVDKMTRFREHILAMLADEGALMAYIDKNIDDIEWD